MLMKKRVPVSEAPSALVGNPFSALNLSGLPAGPESQPEPAAPKMGRVVLRLEKAGRGGKCVIVAGGFAPHFSGAALDEFARRARVACGCGGTVANREIELQGGDAARVRAFFAGEGFRVDGV